MPARYVINNRIATGRETASSSHDEQTCDSGYGCQKRIHSEVQLLLICFQAVDVASETAEPSQVRDEWSESTGGVKISYCTSCAMK